MNVATSTGIAVVVALTVAVAAWGVFVSVVSSLRGPLWASGFLRASQSVLVVMTILGLGALVLVEPAWIGLAVSYVAGVAAWFAGRVRRVVIRALDGQTDVVVETAQHRTTVRRALIGMAVAGLLAATIGGLAWSSDQGAAIASWTVAAVFALGTLGMARVVAEIPPAE
ncbi:MAG: hypothetical protein OEO77_12265 [Acidimicrobiia bacterium]|nr:hypothetical protein [Acidimicrobiia bacterium]